MTINKFKHLINEVLDIRYIDKNNEQKNKQIIINKKIVPRDQQIDKLKEILESEVLIIYDNNSYITKYYETKYKNIISSNIICEKSLIYATRYCYLESYPNNLF